YDQPALGAVFKLVSIEDSTGQMHDTIKLSNNAEKVSTPGKNKFGELRGVMMASLKVIM
ncbi:nicotinate phosphoribosyltransferase, partial [Lacticaseibacillus rhamnosus MTCC 5462]